MATFYKRGGYFWVDYALNGQRVKKSSHIPISQPDIFKTWFAELQIQVLKGRLGWETQSPFIAEAGERWLEMIRSTKAFQTHRRYRQILAAFSEWFAREHPGQKLLSFITAPVLTEYVAHRASIRHSNTVRFDLACISNWLGWCVRMGYLPKNPAGAVERPRPVRGAIHFFSPEEMRLILEGAGDRRDWYEFLYRTLARAFSEARRFTRRQVDFERNVLVFEEATTKARRREEIEIPAALRPMLERRCAGLKPEDPIFPAEAAISPKNLSHHFTMYLKRLHLQGSLHTLRHTGISHLVMPPSPVPLRVVMQLARHRDLKTTLRYAHLSPEQISGSGYINCLPI